MSEEEYWQQRAEREQAEDTRRQRRRKTLPVNIIGGIIAVAIVLYFVISIAINAG